MDSLSYLLDSKSLMQKLYIWNHLFVSFIKLTPWHHMRSAMEIKNGLCWSKWRGEELGLIHTRHYFDYNKRKYSRLNDYNEMIIMERRALLLEALFTRDISAHNITIKIKRCCDKKIILSHWCLKANQGKLLMKHRVPWFVVR